MNANPSRTGQINAAGDVLALLLKVFAGEVLTAFQRHSLYHGLQTLRTISSGKSAQFPALGQYNSGYYHTPGEEIIGEKIKNNERIINIEGQYIAPIFISNIDEAMSHFDVRGPYAQEIAQHIAKVYDQNIHRTHIMAARATTPTVEDTSSGNTLDGTLTGATYGTDGAVIVQGLIDLGVILDGRDVPRMGRFSSVDPTRYALVLKSNVLSDYRLNAGLTGPYGQVYGNVPDVDGMPLYKTNNFVTANDLLNTNLPTARRLDYSTSRALVSHPKAVGTVALQNVTTESAYDIRRQGTLMLGKFICGHDVLQVEAAGELQSSAPAT